MKRILSVLFASALALAGMDAAACTTAVISARASATGRPMLFKQRDTRTTFNYVDFFEATDSTFAFTGVVGTKDEARASVWEGANSEGFAIMNAVAYGLSPIITEDRPWEGIIMKRALGICRTVGDFENCIKSLPQPNGLEASFGVIDSEGGAAYFEVHDLGYTRFDVDDTANGYIIRTNYALTGREGEGLGYDRFAIATSKMAAHGGPFTAEWLIDALGRNPVIARNTTASSAVIEGVGPSDAKNSSVIWCAPGYTPAAFAIPSWVAAGEAISIPLRAESGRGSELNEIAWELLKKHFLPNYREDSDGFIRCNYDKGRCRRILSAVAAAEQDSFAAGRTIDSLVRAGSARPEDFRKVNETTVLIWQDFARAMKKFL